MNPLKKITLTQKNKNGLSLLLIFFFFGLSFIQAQVQNNGVLYIADNGTFFVKSGNFNFGAGSQTRTSRSSSTSGKLVFDASATHTGAVSGTISDVINGINVFVDGYASTKSSSYFNLPTGQSSTIPVYAPIGITNATVTNGVSAAYVNGTPANSANLDASVAALYSVGSWSAYGDNAKLTLIWINSISALTNSISDLTVAGYNISTSKWEVFSPVIATGSISSGTVSTTSAVNLATYSSYTIAKKGIYCAPVFVATGTTKTWNGSWPSGAPTEIDNAIIASAGSPGSFVCNTLAVNANISLLDGDTIEVVNAITGTGVITMSSQASIYQRNDASGIDPTIALTKSTRTGMCAQDYVYWGTPLKSTVNTFALLGTARAYTNSNASTSGAVGAFDNYFKYVAGDTSTAGGWKSLTANPVSGTGFITNIINQSPFILGTPNITDHINLTFTGATNNGSISVPIANSIASPTSDRNFNFFGNPYPSAIDAFKFLEYNTNLDGAVYIWKATTPRSAIVGSGYTIADYIAYTRAGSTADTGISTTVFNGKIATGQGFRVKAATTSGTGTATFNNCMRVSGSNDQFMKTLTTVDRYKLNFKGDNNIGNQILVAYMPQTTLGYDRMYDAELNSVSPAQMYSILDNSTTQLGINARPTFTTNDVVNLGIDKSNTSFENFSIAIAEKEGVFQGTEINVLLHDKILQIYHNLANGEYNFTSNSTQLVNRFEVVYQDAALGNSDFDTNSVFATINNQALKINASLPITNVLVFDLTGRLVSRLVVDNQLQVNQPFNYALGVYIVKIKMNNGETTTQKLINK